MAFKKPTVKRSATDISKITGFIMQFVNLVKQLYGLI